jgi:uncharacterized SAM-binding protein YcdF (DUF218 family)
MWWLVGVALALAGVWFVRVNRHDHWVWWLVGGSSAAGGLLLAILTFPPWLQLQKIAGALLMPIGIAWLLLIFFCWVLRTQPRLRWVVWGTTVFFTLAGNGWVAGGLLAWLEAPYRGIRPLAAGDFDAVIVLGGGSATTPDGRGALGDSGDRIHLGALLYRHGQTPLLITGGRSIAGVTTERDLAAETSAVWQDLGVSDGDILCLDAAHTTAEELARLAELQQAEEDGRWHRIGLVTSAWHLRRALAHARDHGLTVEPLPADFRGDLPPVSALHLIPQARHFAAGAVACWEILGLITGR